MVAIAYVDARRFMIPDELTISGFALGLLQAAVGSEDGIAVALANAGMRAAALAAAFWLLRFTYRWLRGRDGLGFGDVKLAGVAGVWLAVTTIPIALEVAALGALAIYVVRQRMLGRPLRRGNRLPFGAFFAPAIWCAWMVQILMAGR
jgi:leader peptidase (prepilin peptidase)/N-methyltransferase